MANDTTVEVRDLHKYYGDFHALRGVGFEIRRGEIVGLLGPNGAGKSTTMKILTCYMAATGGQARVAGRDVAEDSLGVRSRVGYLPENVPLYDLMLVAEYIEHMAELRGVPKARRDERVAWVIRACGLGPVAGKRIDELSKGYRQRVGLAQAIVHEPEVLILDEPTSGLDPNQIVEIRELIREIGREKTVLLSTHVLQEIEALCDRILVISDGRLVADGTVAALLAQNPSCRTLEELFRFLTGSFRPTHAAAAETATPEGSA
jgi:ABC-2 type transport system ATP-binding protein